MVNNKYCIVPRCFNSTVKTPDKLFIYVPLDPEIRKKWMIAAKRVDSLGPKTKAHCCEDHFDLENDMENYVKYKLMGHATKIRMKTTCVPSRFDCQLDRKDMSTSEPRPAFIKRQRMSLVTEIEENIQNENHNTSSPSGSQAISDVYCPDETETDDLDVKYPLPSISVCNLVEQITPKEEVVEPSMNDPLPRFDPASVCRCCLSPSRSLGPLSRSPPWAGAPSVCARVCWECAATLARACSFRERVNAAEAALRRATETQITTEIKSLSTLTSSTKDTYDYVFEFDYRLNETYKPKPRRRKQKLQAKVESENTIFLPHTIEVQEIITQHDIKKEQDISEVKIESTDLFSDHDCHDTTSIDVTTDNKDAASCNNDAASYNYDTTINNSDVISDNYNAASDINDAATDVSDTDNDEPLVHVNVIQDSDNPLEHEYEVKYLTEEEMRQRRLIAYSQASSYRNCRFKCEMCLTIFRTRRIMGKHMDRRHGLQAGRYMCTVCQQRFAAPGTLADHCRRHYLSYSCRRCEFTCRLLTKMKLHVRGHAPRQDPPKEVSLATRRRAERPKYICDKCGLEFLRRYQIENHFRFCSVSPTEPHLGSECGICYETIDYPMPRHYRTCHHPTERPRCRLCRSELRNQSGYVTHMAFVHMPKKYKCKLCNKPFGRKYLRQLHIERMHGTLQHKCTECEKVFSSNISLNAHLKRVHVRVRANLCMYCGFSLENLTALREHLRIHTGERPYQCAHCHRAFAQRSNIISHIKCVHKELMRHTPAN